VPELSFNVRNLFCPFLFVKFVGFLLGAVELLPFGLDSLHFGLKFEGVKLDRLILFLLFVQEIVLDSLLVLKFSSKFGHLLWLDRKINTCIKDTKLILGPFALLRGHLLEVSRV
jgi:hypothetical protein